MNGVTRYIDWASFSFHEANQDGGGLCMRGGSEHLCRRLLKFSTFNPKLTLNLMSDYKMIPPWDDWRIILQSEGNIWAKIIWVPSKQKNLNLENEKGKQRIIARYYRILHKNQMVGWKGLEIYYFFKFYLERNIFREENQELLTGDSSKFSVKTNHKTTLAIFYSRMKMSAWKLVNSLKVVAAVKIKG